MLRRDIITPEYLEQLIVEYGTLKAAARALFPQFVGENGQPLRTPSGLEKMFYRVRAGKVLRGAMETAPTTSSDATPTKKTIMDSTREDANRIVELLNKAGVSPEALASIDKVTLKSYGAFIKNAEGEMETKPMHSTHVVLTPVWQPPKFPVITQAPPTKIHYSAPPRILRKTRMVVVISDMQIGWLRDGDTDALDPIHDPDAIDVAKQITADVQPDELVFIGDTADLPMFSRWAQHPEFRGTVQKSINTAHDELASIISAAGPQCKKRMMIGSNHDVRIQKQVLEWNKEAMYVRRAGDVEGWPVFSFEYLVRLDELGIKWSGQYPGGEYYILPDLVAMHAPPKSKEFRTRSVIHGHTHKISRTPFVTHGYEGRLTHSIYDVGCLCQVGTTENKKRLLVTRTPSDRGRTDWLQGIAVVSISEAFGSRGAMHAVEQPEIIEGWASYRGQEYNARKEAV